MKRAILLPAGYEKGDSLAGFSCSRMLQVAAECCKMCRGCDAIRERLRNRDFRVAPRTERLVSETILSRGERAVAARVQASSIERYVTLAVTTRYDTFVRPELDKLQARIDELEHEVGSLRQWREAVLQWEDVRSSVFDFEAYATYRRRSDAVDEHGRPALRLGAALQGPDAARVCDEPGVG